LGIPLSLVPRYGVRAPRPVWIRRLKMWSLSAMVAPVKQSDSNDAGAASLVACRDAANGIAGGLHYRTCSGGAGQDALLQAYADEH